MQIRAATAVDAAFQRIELLSIIAGLSAVVFVAIPVLASPASHAKRTACYSNLRQLGNAVQLWGNEHNDRLPFATLPSEGGTWPVSGSKAAVVWLEYSMFSNVLANPRVLACPADDATKSAETWSSFVNSGFRANAVSYFLSYHARPDGPGSIIAGDRDITASGTGGGCSRSAVNNNFTWSGTDPSVRWTNELHAPAGHLLAMDGSVAFVPSARLALSLDNPLNNETGTVHYSPPR